MESLITIIVSIFLLIAIIWFLKKLLHLIQSPSKKGEHPANKKTKNQKEEISFKGAYHKKWMFTYNEKDAYKKLKPIAEEMGYTVFAKVRLLDLLEPVRGTDRYKTYLNKVQAKHVDFVLCDEKLVARHIVELDDSSHDTPERKERDQFVDEILKNVGYNIIHVRAITEDIREQLK